MSSNIRSLMNRHSLQQGFRRAVAAEEYGPLNLRAFDADTAEYQLYDVKKILHPFFHENNVVSSLRDHIAARVTERFVHGCAEMQKFPWMHPDTVPAGMKTSFEEFMTGVETYVVDMVLRSHSRKNTNTAFPDQKIL